MGAFFIVRKQSDGAGSSISSTLREHFSRQGFTRPKKLHTDEYELFLYKKIVSPEENFVEFGNGDFCACTGTFIFQGTTGAEGLRRFYEHFSGDEQDYEGLYGAFCIVIRKDSRSHLLLDRLGIYKAYRSVDDSVFSSSFLTMLAAQTSRRANTQSIYEYVFDGATFGGSTIVDDVCLLEPATIYGLDHETSKTRVNPHWPRMSTNVEDSLDENLTNLRDFYRDISSCFGENIDTALSGGYDSRLTLALLRDQGITPKLHVYGAASDADVRVATDIARREDLQIKHIDKGRFPDIERDRFPEVVSDSFHNFDGFPNDGIFGNGADFATRQDRCRNGELMLNGGGGEIFRNFFYLRNTRLTLRQFLWVFHSRFDPRTCTPRFSEARHHEKLERKIRATLNIDHSAIDRREIDLLYPLFRCNFWMGRNNSINNRLGFALTPFIDYKIVAGASRIPTRAKDYGRFEASLITRLDKRLAGYDSAYGHPFDKPPAARRVLKEQLTYIRPAWLRRLSYRLQAPRRNTAPPYFLSEPFVSSVLEADFPFMREYFRPEAVRDWEQYNRMCTLEYLFQQYPADVGEH